MTSRRPTGKPLVVKVDGKDLPLDTLVAVYKAAAKPGAVKALELAKACLEREIQPSYFDVKITVVDQETAKPVIEEVQQLELFPHDDVADLRATLDNGYKQELEDLYLLLRESVEGY